jgi:hypothetical protein
VRGSPILFQCVSLLTVAAIILAACGGSNGEDAATPAPTPSPAATADPNCGATPAAAATGNALQNGDFESGSDPWTSLATQDWGRAFEVSQAQAHSGANSAYLQLRSQDGGATKVYGVVQELGAGEFPETLSGYYYVDAWEQGTPKQYLQFVVIVNSATNIPQEVKNLSANNHQIRYILAGVETQPTSIANSRYVMVSTEQPQVGQWVRFERNVRQDFCELWGNLPSGFTGIRVLFETRWDERKDTDVPSSADVYYDDLSWGPAAEAP